MTSRSSTAEPVPVGWPLDQRQLADEAQLAHETEELNVSRETSTGLGWPEFTA